MSRIQKTFERLKPLNRTALVTFIMAGDPGMETSLEVLKGMPEAGADIIEIGMPFTDPAADGLTIQKAGQRALKVGMTLSKTLQMIKDFRAANDETPIILMGYANPLYAYDLEKFANDASKAGVDGLIIVDLPPEEDGPLREHTEKHGIDIIRLVTPTTDEKRLEKVLDGASGFLYYVSITGVTGTAKADLNNIKPHIDSIKSKTKLPVAIGFGIKTPEDARDMSALSDAVVVGSAIVAKVHEPQQALQLVSDLSAVLGPRG
ncbi:MAG: tryptophan synthase subunit alpha [Alphaproteobacteria bacterium]|nr:tryptophan synthase subunit alpha [Alphaproteobacteria bacterium]